MKRWAWRILLAAAVAAALTVGVSAAYVKPEKIDGTVIDGVIYKDGEVTGYTDSLDPVIVIRETVKGTKTTKIGFEAFINNDSIQKVIIPENITEIGTRAFAQCDSLTDVIFREAKTTPTPAPALTIQQEAFAACSKLSVVSFSKNTATTINPKSFQNCPKLTRIIIWKGTVASNAFSLCDALDNVVIGEDVTSIQKDSFFNLKILHYMGTDKTKLTWDADDIHLVGGEVQRTSDDATCESKGSIVERIYCGATDTETQKKCGFDFDRKIEIPALGHDFPPLEIPDPEKAKHLVCEEWEYKDDVTCARDGCDHKEERVTVVEAGDHVWNDAAPDTDEGRKDEYIAPTCAAEGSEPTIQTCKNQATWKEGETTHTKNCEEKILSKRAVSQDKDKDGNLIHTYTNKNTVTKTTLAPSCLYDGVKVTYLMCDGNHEAGIKTCVLGENGADKCAELLAAIDQAKEDLEEALEAALETAPAPAVQDDSGETGEGGGEVGGGEEGGGEGGEEPAPPESDAVEAARDALKAAVEAYAGHLEKEHKRVGAEDAGENECVVAVERVAYEEGGHTGPIRTVSSETTGIGGGKYICTEGGTKTTTTVCDYCGEEFVETETIAPKDHKIPEGAKTETIPRTCTEPGKIKYLEDTECEECGYVIKAGDIVNSAGSQPNGHRWNDFVQTEITKKPTCAKGEAKGTATCEDCGAVEELTIELAPVANHTWGPWVKSADGKEETRTCSVCGEKQTNPLTPAEPDGPGTSDPGTSDPGSSDPGTTDPGPSKPDPNAEYTVTVTHGPGGTAAVSKTRAKAGASVTVTVSPYSGYELDMIRVTGTATATDLTGSRRSFTMPASNVSVTVSFSPIDSGSGWGGASNGAAGDPTRSRDNTPVQITPQSIPRAGAWGQIFSDIPTGHWAAGEINWANRMGYMNGTEGRFNPDESITCQQMWMVLARLTGSYPANMADARRWAVEGNFADASSPTAPVARHQLVTALYRCAHLKGGVSRSNASLAGYADSRVVPAAARDAFAWAVSNGIVSGTSGSRLEPNGTVTRAQFAVILYRYSQRV